MMILGWLGLAFAALVLVHMARPGLERRRLSSARFFKDLPPIRKGAPRWRWGHPFSSAPLYLHLPILGLVAAAVLLSSQSWARREAKALGLWILVDVSASMSASRGESDRMAAAREEALAVIARAREVGTTADPRVHLSTFDLEQRDLTADAPPDLAGELIGSLSSRALGTDLNIPRVLADRIRNAPDPGREITHLVVITDMPAPDWTAGEGAPVIIWRDVGLPASNVGFTDIHASRHPLTGLVKSVAVRITAFGQAPSDARFFVYDAEGVVILSQSIRWRADHTWQGSFPSPGPGPCSLRVTPGDAYAHDNFVALSIPDNRAIRVDWRLEDRSLPARMGWVVDKTAPHLRVASGLVGDNDAPLLLVGYGYGPRAGVPGEIWDFRDGSPLLEDVNFDVVEAAGMSRGSPPGGFTPILRGADQRVWVAWRRHPPAIRVPGAPTGGDDNLGRLSATLFFNAVRLLLRERPPAPLFSRTSPDHPEPGDGRAALHDDEGNTARTPRSFGRIEDISPAVNVVREAPIWPVLLAAAALLLMLERALASYGGASWR